MRRADHGQAGAGEQLEKVGPEPKAEAVFQIQMEMSKQLLIFWLQLWDLLEMKS